MASRLRAQRSDNIWPGFVDALATLLLVIIFLLVVFVLAHVFLSQALSGRDEALDRLNSQISELANLLALERDTNTELRDNITQLSASLQESTKSRDALDLEVESLRVSLAEANITLEARQKQLIEGNQSREEMAAKVARLEAALAKASNESAALWARTRELSDRLATAEAEGKDKLERAKNRADKALTAEQQISEAALAQVALLNQQLSALRQQLARISDALEASEARDRKQQTTIIDLGKRLNVALAKKVEELARYRSEFFGRLKAALGARRDVQVVGDRFVFQSEVLFTSGSADLGAAGQIQITKLAETILDVARKIPKELPWVLRVDGHTDRVPISTARFPSNWELSTARALSVVNFLIEVGVPPDRLAATGFGEFQPLDERDDEIAYRRNRRIEIKLTQR